MSLSSFTVGEEPGGLDDDVGTQFTPVDVLRIALSQSNDALATNGDGLVVVGYLGVEVAQNGVPFEQVGESLIVSKVIDCNDLKIGALLQSGAEEVTADAAEAVDSDASGHYVLLVSLH